MKTLAGWIVGVFALGLVAGGFFRGIASEDPGESALADLPSVDCGPEREALFEPVVSNGTTTLRVRCVAQETETAMRAAAPAPVPIIVTAPAPAPAPQPVVMTRPVMRTTAPAPDVVYDYDYPDANAEAESRSWERSAVIIGSSAGAGAGIGALAKGKKGALVGAAIGGVAGTVYDLSTRKND